MVAIQPMQGVERPILGTADDCFGYAIASGGSITKRNLTFQLKRRNVAMSGPRAKSQGTVVAQPYFRLAPSPYLIPFNSLNRLMSAPNSSATRARSVVFFTSSCS